jgi:hypothetical protein
LPETDKPPFGGRHGGYGQRGYLCRGGAGDAPNWRSTTDLAALQPLARIRVLDYTVEELQREKERVAETNA